MSRCHACRHAFTLVEMLIVVALIAMVVVVSLPSLSPAGHQHLQAAAEIVAGDLSQARSLAVNYGSKYQVTFNLGNNSYTLEHSGTNTSLDALPSWAFRSPGDPADQHIVRLPEIPSLGTSPPRLLKVTVGGANSPAAAVEFDGLGATTATGETVIWLQAGEGSEARYAAVRVNPVTGLSEVEPITATAP